MGQGAWIRKQRDTGTQGGWCSLIVLGLVLLWSVTASAEPGRGRPELSAEPQRSYGSIDVILYQTSW